MKDKYRFYNMRTRLLLQIFRLILFKDFLKAYRLKIRNEEAKFKLIKLSESLHLFASIIF